MGIITLLTDFGYADNYVGVMKGVIVSIAPRCRIVDLTHGIAPQAILAARFNLLTSYQYFSANTIHVVVVDPGVGTKRAAIAAQVTAKTGNQTIVAPDNGIFTGFSIIQAITLTNRDYWLTPQPSNTFHGRDVFAPVAAHLANGISLEKLGSPISATDLVQLPLGNTLARKSHHGYYGCIQYVDQFGNLITTIPSEKLVQSTQRSWQIMLAGQTVPYYTTYGQTAPGTALALTGSHGYIEVAVNGGSAAERFLAQVGDPVELMYVPHGLGREEP